VSGRMNHHANAHHARLSVSQSLSYKFMPLRY
jgi:hypothetical protein